MPSTATTRPAPDLTNCIIVDTLSDTEPLDEFLARVLTRRAEGYEVAIALNPITGRACAYLTGVAS